MSASIETSPARLPDWARRLAHLLAEAGPRPLRYGRWDCAQFARAAILAQTGRDVAPTWGYASRAEGLRKMRADGHADHVAFFRSFLPGIDRWSARPGDIAIMPGLALGVVQGRELVYVVRPSGLGLAPRAEMIGGLRV